jgi:uncharacterized phage protein (TIGR01671 family)
MNDRFRFRVWDGKRYVTTGIMFNNTLGTIEPVDGVLEQCTGLKDKNGKLIFEGDILLHHHAIRDWQSPPVKWSEIEGEEGDEYVGFNISEGCARDAEIIGTIHENPELIEG